jgi:site-specific recombinase XerD
VGLPERDRQYASGRTELRQPRLREGAKRARIEDFSWHCLRRPFTSRLTMKGVDLNAIRELTTF